MSKNWIFKDNVDTDVIIPARYLNTKSSEELALHCMEDIDKNFSHEVKEGDFIIAGYNFGCGSSREHAPIAIKASGIRAVIAKSFARIFYRNAINIGLVIIENDKIQDNISSNDIIELNINEGIIKNITKNETYNFSPYPDEIQKLIEAGGLVNYTKQKIRK
ncbi:MAG: 3-isopropylmalate dehydratase small subunit [Candidatus Gastranaerophilales bacterium]|nr:3-isopropylmalate dehydratase small subunit [Candidatus Gastranaerophilales bacterium]